MMMTLSMAALNTPQADTIPIPTSPNPVINRQLVENDFYKQIILCKFLIEIILSGLCRHDSDMSDYDDVEPGAQRV